MVAILQLLELTCTHLVSSFDFHPNHCFFNLCMYVHVVYYGLLPLGECYFVWMTIQWEPLLPSTFFSFSCITMVANLLTHEIIIIFSLCRARSSTSHTSSRLTVSRLRWQPVLTSTCSLFCSLRLPLHPVRAWPKLCRARIRSSWWALLSSAAPYRDAKTPWKFLHVLRRRRVQKRDQRLTGTFGGRAMCLHVSDLWLISRWIHQRGVCFLNSFVWIRLSHVFCYLFRKVST